MLLLLITLSLTVAAWRKWEQYLIITLPVGLGLLISTIDKFPQQAPVISLVVILILAYDILNSSHLKNLLLKIDPKMVLRATTKGAVFVLAVFSGIIFFLQAQKSTEVNWGKKAAEIANQYITPAIENQVNSQIESQYGIPGITDLLPGGASDEVGKVVESQVNNFINPYKMFVNPILALLTFTIFQFYGGIAYLLYSLLVDLVFYIAKQTGFFKIEKVPAEKEILTF
jgi:hypothetical protein